MRPGNRREFFLGYFGPLSLILLLIIWAVVLIFSFALLQWGLSLPVTSPEKTPNLGTYLYFSGTTFITLGLGDVVPSNWPGRTLAVIEAGTGFGFLALIIGYVPVIYQAFSRRETSVSLLDARAGSPSTATELLRRHFRDQHGDELILFLRTWELWCAELLESHLSYPVLIYYRSQHERQSWLAALTTILDTSALLMVGIDGMPSTSVRFTFAMARHAAVDLAQIYGTAPTSSNINRLSSADFTRMRASLAEVGLKLHNEADAEARLAELRLIYEPFINAIARYLFVTLPPWIVETRSADDWQTSAWDHFAQWSPAKISEITQIISSHKKSTPLLVVDKQDYPAQQEQQFQNSNTVERP